MNNSKLASISVQVSCASFAVTVFGATSAMAVAVDPYPTMQYDSVNLTADFSTFEFDLNDDGVNDLSLIHI